MRIISSASGIDVYIAILIVIFTMIVSGGILLFYNPLVEAAAWRAAITPLASIMGSGFLGCAPLL